MSANAMCPKPTKPVPPGTFSAPSEVPLTLAAPDSQIWAGWWQSWRTVTEISDCDGRHDPMCRQFRFADGGIRLHLSLSLELWVRHPVDGAR